MQPPISAGTVLQNRYHILRLLGQGGFGRTYLAEDRGRFDELCAIKEYLPPHAGTYALEKSKELFEREASILYQIQHSQVPQFRAVFEEDDRFFLIQDYVAGQTYSELLTQRTNMGYSFSGAEVLDLLGQLLPVLIHIHDRGIIHRDISPDNIILRDRDQMPVLIDFGVVKAIMSNLKPTPPGQRTTVGKLGYAPMEQVQMGQAYPSSDLYSLGVTAIVLLTGKQPNQLKDPPGQWTWKRYTTTTDPLLLSIIDRLLEPRPSDRYQSARDVLLALGKTPDSASDHHSVPTVLPVAPDPSPGIPDLGVMDPQATASPDMSTPPPEPEFESATEIRSRHATTRIARSSTQTPPTPPPSSFLDDPVAVIAAAISLVALTGIGSWAIVRTFLVQQPNLKPAPSASPMIVETGGTPMVSFPTPSPTPSAGGQALPGVSYQQPITLLPNQPQRFERHLTQYETQTYTFVGKAGQSLSAFIAGEGVLLTIAGPDQKPVSDRADRVSQWKGTLPQDGPYRIILRPVDGLRDAGYSLELTLDNTSSPSPASRPTGTSPQPSALQSPQYREQSLSLPSNVPITLGGQVSPSTIQRYWMNLNVGDTLNAQLVAGNAQITLLSPEGDRLQGATLVRSFSVNLPRSGLYSLEVTSDAPASFNLTLGVKSSVSITTPSPTLNPTPVPTPTPTPTPHVTIVTPLSTPTPNPQETATPQG